MSRLAYFTSGPSFSRSEDGTVMFTYQVDASNCIGPRKATDADKSNNLDAWRTFEAKEAFKKNEDEGKLDFMRLEKERETIANLDTFVGTEVPFKRRPGRPKKAA